MNQLQRELSLLISEAKLRRAGVDLDQIDDPDLPRLTWTPRRLVTTPQREIELLAGAPR